MASFLSKGDDNAKRHQPSKATRKRVKESFDAGRLIDICARQDFGAYAEKFLLTPNRNGDERFYWYQDNHADVLAVAHLDSVQRNNHCSVTDTGAGLLATSGVLDDRLGAYVILDMLPKLGLNVDWLLTTDEESASSTAIDFETTKHYNWMIQFDRGGTDVVMYQYEDPEIVRLVEQSGARVGTGSYSDIVELDFLGCAAFNWGVAYEDYHSARAHAWLEDTFRMVARFDKFYRANHATHFPYADDYRRSIKRRWWDWDDVDDDDALPGTKVPISIGRGHGQGLDLDDPDWDSSADGDETADDHDYSRFLVADCAHEIDVCDADSYVATAEAIVCRECGTADGVTMTG